MSKRMAVGISKVIGKRRWSEADAGIVVAAWRRSGKVVPEFAREYGLTAQRLHRWSERLEGGSSGKVRFHPVHGTCQEYCVRVVDGTSKSAACRPSSDWSAAVSMSSGVKVSRDCIGAAMTSNRAAH